MGSRITFKTLERLGDGTISRVDRTGEKLDLGADLDFAIDHRNSEWVVTELSSGMMLCVGDTRRKAEDKARAMMGTEEGCWAVQETVRRWTEHE